jgi:hypothetical protein
MKILTPINANNYTDFKLEGKTLVCKRGMFVVESIETDMGMGVKQQVQKVDNQVVGVFLHNNQETYIITEV